MDTRKIGNISETLVCSYLESRGYVILKRNFQIREGEIDIIASFNNIICAVEVKKIPSKWSFEEMMYKINPAKILRIKKTMSIYLATEHDYKYDEIRFDVAAVQDEKVTYWEGAF